MINVEDLAGASRLFEHTQRPRTQQTVSGVSDVGQERSATHNVLIKRHLVTAVAHISGPQGI